MSKVYEALERARREMRRQSDGDTVRTNDGPEALKADRPAVPQAARMSGEAWAPEIVLPSENRDGEAAHNEAPEQRTRGVDDMHSSAPVDSLPPRQTLARLWPWTRARTAPRLVIEDEAASNVAEQFQVLRASVERFAAERESSVIMVSSALAGEGKSFVCLNLAATLAMAGARVLLVDADLRRPSLHRAFNLVSLTGLKRYLEGQCDFASCLHATPFESLSIVPTGGQVSFASPLLSGARMREFVSHARSLSPAHIVLIDTPAALVAPDAEMMSRLADCVLLVVEANTSPRAQVREVLDLFSEIKVLGAVLNRFRCSYSASKQLRYGSAYSEREEAGRIGQRYV
jgi:capsular exopolysaccharide synthesis family protein